MGGRGSGRSSGYRRYNGKGTTSDNLPLDIRTMQRAGYLRPGAYSTWCWWHGGHTPEADAVNKARGASIGCLARENSVLLIYSHCGQPIRQSVPVLRTSCNYGGSRVWWQCPACAQRVPVIYGAGKRFACRHCYGLCYASQKENRGDRALRTASKIRKRLGQEFGGHVIPPPDKPPGMHWTTYSRLRLRCAEAEHVSWTALGLWLDRMEGR